MLKKLQIISVLFVILILVLIMTSTNCDYDVGLLAEKAEAQSLWQTSGHADATTEAFTHWNEDSPPVVEIDCAKCHSTQGFLDYLGADGTQANVVDTAPPIGTTIYCEVCHTDRNTGTLRDHTSVIFPSTVEVENLGPEAICMECHQGRESSPDVDEEITDAAVADDDTISSDIGFLNIHYAAAGAMQFGTVTKGGYEYDGNDYDAQFSHVTGYTACSTCHNPHSLEVELDACNTCHTDISDPKNIRYYGSFTDYDGDGDTTEGIYYEVEGLKEKLYEGILAYGNQIGYPIAYASSYPYFVNDTDGDGVADESEVSRSNRYTYFTARLLKAVYNYQTSLKDHGGYAHGGKYIMELLYDSIEDLNEALNNPVDLEDAHRDDEGHFDGSRGAWRRYDSSGEVTASCARCHSAAGLPYFLENGEDIVQEPSNGLLCTTCHTSPPAVRTAGAVTFPSGVSKDMGDSSNLCLNCHSGRSSMADVDEELADPGPWSAPSIHYYPVAAVLYGGEANGLYEFPGKTYMGLNPFPSHNGSFDTCVECHMGTQSPRKTDAQSSTYGDHSVYKPNPEDCVLCHGYDVSQPNPGFDPSKFKFSGIRPGSIPDFDMDGNTSESLEAEILGLQNAVVIQAAIIIGTPQVFYHGRFYNDLNDNGEVDDNETGRSNRTVLADARILKAAYNLQITYREPHAYIHNPFYIAQVYVDTLEHLGGNVSAYIWR